MPAVSMQDAFAVLDTYQRQIQTLVRQLDFLGAVLEEVTRAKNSLEGLKGESSADVLIPLGANTFIRGSATDKKVAISGIGAGYCVEKPWPEAIARLTQREADIRGELERVSQATVELQQEAARLQEQLEEAQESAAERAN